MSWLDRLRGWVWRVEERANELEYAALGEVHKVEDRLDEATLGRFYDAVVEVDEHAEELLHGLGLDREPGDAPAEDGEGAPSP